MEKVDYLIVGDGYAGLFFAHHLFKNGKSFRIFSDGKKGASRVSAGIINPVVLKKFTTFWKAQEQIDFLKKTLSEIQRYTTVNYLIEKPIHRIFHDDNEKNLWLKKSENPELHQFLNKVFTEIDGIENPHLTGKVNQSARLNVNAFFEDILFFLQSKGFLVRDNFNYAELIPKHNTYRNFKYKNIVFCEGMGVKNNPYFQDIPVQPNKGHHLEVELSKEILQKVTLKKKHFLFPLENGNYYYGGTYDRDQIHQEIDASAVTQLKNGLSEFYKNYFDTVKVNFGFRPTVKDRRPILGNHEVYKNLYVFNGLGARGILNGCYFAHHLFEHIELNKELHPEVNIDRFKK